LTPGNEAGSTLPRVNGTASKTPAYMLNGSYAPLSQLQSIGRSATPAAASADSSLHWSGQNGFEPWLTTQPQTTYQSQAQTPVQSSGSGARASQQSEPYDYVAAANEAFPVQAPEGPRRRIAPIQDESVDQLAGDDELSKLLQLLESGVVL
jgi:hypothetical protein